MSGRIRTIKPELLEDAVTARLSSVAFRTFIALIVLADDYGNFRAEPRFLEGHIFWSTTPERPLEEVLLELWDGTYERLPKVRKGADLCDLLARVAIARKRDVTRLEPKAKKK